MLQFFEKPEHSVRVQRADCFFSLKGWDLVAEGNALGTGTQRLLSPVREKQKRRATLNTYNVRFVLACSPELTMPTSKERGSQAADRLLRFLRYIVFCVS